MSYYILATLIFSAFAGAFAHAKSGDYPGELDLNLRQNRYLGESVGARQGSNYTLFSGELNLEPRTSSVEFKLNSLTEGALEGKDEFYFGVPEMYLRVKKMAPDFALTIGREKRHWSRLDEEFDLGVWQPQLRWDYLQPRQQGLIGIFLDWKPAPRLHLTFLSSPLFLPDQGPNFKLTDGQFSSGNRWFRPPQSRIALFEGTRFAKDAPLNFELERPAEGKIIMNPTFGLGLEYEMSGGWWTALNYAYKPRNQIHLGIECASCAEIGGVQPLEVTALIHPVIVMHNVATLETGFTRQDDAGWISLSYDKPNKSGLPADFEEAPLDAMMIAGLSYRHFLPPVLIPASWIKFSYMQAFVVAKTDAQGLIDSDQVQSSLDRYPYKEIAATEWRALLDRSQSHRWDVGVRYLYSIREKGGWISADVGYAQGAMTYSIGADVMGAGVSPSSPDAGLISRYRANDRVYAGVGYVF